MPLKTGAKQARRRGLPNSTSGKYHYKRRAVKTAKDIKNGMGIKEQVSDFNSLFNAMLICRRDVMWKDSTAKFVANGLSNCYKLKRDLDKGTYDLQPYSRFTIHEPKERDIVATRMRDRVFQRSLCDNYLYSEITKRFIYDNCACQEHRGTDFARKRLMVLMQRHFRKHGLNGWVLKCDVKHFFPSIPHETALRVLKKYIKDEWVYKELERIVRSFATEDNPNSGLGLGSQISQLAALAILNEVDHYIKEQLHIKCYIRYMDDFILIFAEKEYLQYCWRAVQDRVTALGLTLHPTKTLIFELAQPIKFLGFSFRLTKTGKVVRKVLPEKISHERRKLKGQYRQVQAGRMTKEHMDECYNAHRQHLKYGNNHNVIRRMDRFYSNLTAGKIAV